VTNARKTGKKGNIQVFTVQRKKYMHKRLLALLLAGIMVLGTACASKEEKMPLEDEKPAEEEVAETEEPEESSESAWTYPVDPVEDLQDDMLYHIGIVEQADHPAIRHAVESFQEELSTRLEGNVSFEIRCIDNDEDACAAIVTQFMAGNWDLVLTAGTMPTRIAAQASTGTPVVGICVTDFIAAEIGKSNSEPGGRASGSSCMVSMKDVWEMLKYVNTSDEPVGVVFSEGDIASRYQYEVLRLYAEEENGGWYEYKNPEETEEDPDVEFDIEDYLKVYTVGGSDNLRAVLDQADAECGPIFFPADNWIACRMDVVRNFTLETGTPTIAADANMCIGGTLGCVSVDYYRQGANGAEMAAEVLTDPEAEIGKESVYEMSYSSYSAYNPDIASELNNYIWYAKALDTSVQETEEGGEDQ
jgi:putative ABC transport system substrate-binding protein